MSLGTSEFDLYKHISKKLGCIRGHPDASGAISTEKVKPKMANMAWSDNEMPYSAISGINRDI